MNALISRLAVASLLGALVAPVQGSTQESPTTPKAARVRITQGPELERVDPDFAIVRWMSNNPGGSPVHEGVVRYGTTPKTLTQMATSPIRLNPSHPQTLFRVRIEGLQPRTKYYYTVESMETKGKSDGPRSAVRHFTTP